MKFVIAIALVVMTMVLLSCGQEETNTKAGEPSSELAAKTLSQTAQSNQAVQSSTIQGIKNAKIVFEAFDIDGTLRKSNEWIGKQPVVINVWGTWCGPCRREIPDLVKVYNEYRHKGIEILGLAVKDTPEKVRKFTQQNGMEWTMMMADQNTFGTLGRITGVPTTIFLNKDGQEVARFVGPKPYEVFKKTFESLL